MSSLSGLTKLRSVSTSRFENQPRSNNISCDDVQSFWVGPLDHQDVGMRRRVGRLWSTHSPGKVARVLLSPSSVFWISRQPSWRRWACLRDRLLIVAGFMTPRTTHSAALSKTILSVTALREVRGRLDLDPNLVPNKQFKRSIQNFVQSDELSHLGDGGDSRRQNQKCHEERAP